MRTPRLRHAALTVLALSLALSACASAGGRGSTAGTSDVLTVQDIEPWASQDLFTIVQRMRPAWMQNRAPFTSLGRATIVIIVNGQRQDGTLELLRDYKGTDVEEVRYLNARDATTRFGTDMTAGAILISTKR
ncbi:MAG: hypothetical protein Q8N53_13705 [Longimicrobiales bacterium]|nr:hypothetical protein [Longimicrobiales bacterium]